MEEQMKARRYERSDFADLKLWGEEWGAEYREDQFPLNGFIVEGIAAYFLYSTDSSVCWLENMIARRGIKESVRNEALELLIDAILKEASDLGFTVAYATTDIVSVAKRAKEHGAIIRPAQILLTKDLTSRTQ